MRRFEADLTQNLDEVFLSYTLQLDVLNEVDRKLSQIHSNELIPDKYKYESLDDLSKQFALARKHLESASMLHVLTTTEALLRLDFKNLSSGQKKPKISRRFRKIKRERDKKIRLIADILNTWIDVYPGTAKSIQEFKGMVPLRDWLAHGRYWNPKKFSRPSYNVKDVFDIASEMLNAMQQAV